MIRKIRNTRTFKGLSLTLALSIFFQIVAPTMSWALTGGPAQPEFSSFTPIGTSDMVDLSSGDMSYNIPLMDVGGYPINLAYQAGIGMDDEASWVGLGWNLSVGQINHNVRGISDDFNGDEIQYENYMKPNLTVGANIKVESAAFGVPIDLGVTTAIDATTGLSTDDDVNVGLSFTYNNYNGFTVKPSVGATLDLSQNVSVGFNAESGPDGLTLSPNVSLHTKDKTSKRRNNKLSSNFGASMNSRQGLVSTTISASRLQRAGDQMLKKKSKTKEQGSASFGSSIGFTDQLYTPSNRVGMMTQTLTFNGAFLGGEFLGIEGQTQIGAFATLMTVAQKEQDKKAPSYGYNNTHNAGIDGILDFNREKDGAVSQNTTNLPITNYTYDIHSVQGQGVSGMYRAFRSQVGYVYDARVVDVSATGSLGLEQTAGNLTHTGVDFEGTGVVSYSGKWQNGNNVLNWMEASSVNQNPDYEKVSFKNVGDLSSDRDFPTMFNAEQGDYQPLRVGFTSSKPRNFNRSALSGFKKKINGEGNENYTPVTSPINRENRQLRNQAILNLSIEELNSGIGYGPCVNRGSNAEYQLPQEAKKHHVGEVQIIRNDGARYIYGIPAYNTTKREATFSVTANGNCATGIVDYNSTQLDNPKTLPNDQYLERITTPGYAHAHLLTSVLSTDYVDRTNDGPSTDDFGSYTKFSYKKYSQINPGQDLYKWRVPFEGATYNEGLKSDNQDDRGNYVYGEKEILLIDKISTKTHIAIFEYSARKDAHGVKGEEGGYEEQMKSYKLDKIMLYSIEEYYDKDVNGNQILAPNPTPIKTVHFEYDYSLCTGVPNNEVIGAGVAPSPENQGGKLTLKRLYFTYRNSKMGQYTDYEFEYNGLNPQYNIKGYDYWGNYKPNSSGCANTDNINASEYPFTEQDQTAQNAYSSAWSLTDIHLPSGGKISVTYESDDYGYVQDKKTMRMFKVVGAGDDSNPDGDIDPQFDSEELFGNQLLNGPKRYLYVQVDDDAGLTAGDYIKTLKENPIYFRFLMNMTPLGNSESKLDQAKYDYVTGYFEYEEVNTTNGYNGAEMLSTFDHDNDQSTPEKKVLSIPVRIVEKEGGLLGSAGLTNKVHPISKATWHFGRKYLNKHVYSNLPNGDISTPNNPAIGQVGQLVVDLLNPQIINNMLEIFTGPNATLENKNIGRRFIKEKSWVRLDNPRSYKLGGGCRVATVKMSDVWEDMTAGQGNYQTMNYGQQYNYTLKDGTTSGVATYEPVGNKENPFVQPVFENNGEGQKKLLAPDEENFVEMPFGESFFPSPQVTYSRVTVSNLTAGNTPPSDAGFTSPQVKKLHRTGKVVSEFYTSKDYPTIVDQTIMMAREDKLDALANILKINVQRHFMATQGYVVHLNDMNGKQKAQWVYGEGQTAPISGVEYKYDNHATPDQFSAANPPVRNKGRLLNEVVVIRPDGTVGKGTIGVEVDMVNDFRENKTVSITAGINMNLATIFVGLGVFAAPMPLPDFSNSEDQFRSASTTKVINTFGILKETIAHDAGASVSTRNLAWDERTGEVLLTETVDEFSDRYYTLNYPAHWYYDGMGQAAENIAYESVISNIGGGNYNVSNVGSASAEAYLLPGDEVYFKPTPLSPPSTYVMGWITQVNGNTISIIDESGNPISSAPYNRIKVVRSGRRNLQSAGIMNVTLMRNPLINPSTGNLVSSLGSTFLMASQGSWQDWRIINAGAVDYSDEWFVGCECGVTGSGITNPYRINEKGVWRTRSSRTYLTGRNNATFTTAKQEGFFMSFAPMYRNQNNAWTKSFTGWTYVAEVTQFSPYGFELENVDALNRYSAAQYGYNNTFPMAVGANTRYQEIGFDGFEDYNFDGCEYSEHFKFPAVMSGAGKTTAPIYGVAHTGKYSLKVAPKTRRTMEKKLDCAPLPGGENNGGNSGDGDDQ